MSDEEYDSLSEYYEEEVGTPEEKSEDEKGPTPLKILNEAGALKEPLDKILLRTYRYGKLTVSEVAEEVGISDTEAERHLGELRLQGYIGIEYRDNEKQYFVKSGWRAEEFPSGPVIPLVYQYNLLSDKQRLSAIKEAIDENIEKGDVVADLGAGAGVLSYLAADKADTVYAVEMDREVHKKGQKIMENEGVENVNYIRGDAREVELPEKVDVVMCEMLDTALAAELQVPVMNYAVEKLCGEDSTVIPRDAKTSARLIQSDYEFYGGAFRLPHFEEYGSRKSEVFSDEIAYHHVSFDEKNAELVEQKITMTAEKGGIINGMQLNTDVRFGEGLDFVGASPWLNAPLNLPFDTDIEVETGQEVTVKVSYRLGGGLNNIMYEVTNDGN